MSGCEPMRWFQHVMHTLLRIFTRGVVRAACANTFVCLLTSFMEKTAFVWHFDQHQIRVSPVVCACVRACFAIKF